jgi:hypothetical protein
MDYIKIYNNLVESRKYRGEKKRKNDGFNKHHILPKCLGGKDESSNYVLLTFREHIIAHRLLCEIYPESKALKFAYFQMICSNNSENPKRSNIYKIINGKELRYNTRELEDLRNA